MSSNQLHTLTGHILLFLARPDCVAVLGIYLSDSHLVPILIDASGVYYTILLPWKDAKARLLLCRVLDYISAPPTSIQSYVKSMANLQ